MYTSITKNGILIDAFYNDGICVCIREDDGNKYTYKVDFLPYFYIVFNKELSLEDLQKLEQLLGIIQITKVTKENFEYCYKLEFNNIENLLKARSILFENSISLKTDYNIYEYDISFLYRFFIDKNIYNFAKVSYVLEDNVIKEIKVIDNEDKDDLNYKSLSCALDIEVLPPLDRFPAPENDKIISIAYADSKNNYAVFFLYEDPASIASINKRLKIETKLEELFLFSNETTMLDSFSNYFSSKNPDVIYTYNGDNFDFEYICKRYRKLCGKEFKFENSKISFHKAARKTVSIDNAIHLDVYVLMRLLNYLQVFNYVKFDLNTIYPKLTGKEKLVLDHKDLRNCYLDADYCKIILYNLDDTKATLDLGLNYSGIIFELSKFIFSSCFDILHSSASLLVERNFIKYYFANNLIIPNKPSGDEMERRKRYRFSGAFVKDPISGIHKNLAVVDFRSYHISLMIAYNISPETINCKDNNSDFEEILGNKIYKNKIGFVPFLLENMLKLRISIKEQMKNEKKNSNEYKALHAKQYSLKILLASTYGYMGFAGARWYCRYCLDIMYHLVRSKIQELIAKFSSLGYSVIYGDTDSCILKYENLNKLKEDILEINKNLPQSMFLELEEIYKSGIFVLARSGTKAAKKKYALLDLQGNLKIKGFEFVRRDWCILVKETQKEVLELVLNSGDPKLVIDLVRKRILDLEAKKIPKEKLIIQAIVHKNVDKYKTKNPAQIALQNAINSGVNISSKDLVEYIVSSKNAANISEKAVLYSQASNIDYDSQYYINKQLLPAILPILEVFNISKDSLLTGKTQKGINDFL
ncbi:MAG: DNA-directed DNA polymerase [archaeon]